MIHPVHIIVPLPLEDDTEELKNPFGLTILKVRLVTGLHFFESGRRGGGDLCLPIVFEKEDIFVAENFFQFLISLSFSVIILFADISYFSRGHILSPP